MYTNITWGKYKKWRVIWQMTENSTADTIKWEAIEEVVEVRREKKFYLQASYNRFVQINHYKGLVYVCLVPELREATELTPSQMEGYRKMVDIRTNDLYFSKRALDVYLTDGVVSVSDCFSPKDFLLVSVETETMIPFSDFTATTTSM